MTSPQELQPPNFPQIWPMYSFQAILSNKFISYQVSETSHKSYPSGLLVNNFLWKSQLQSFQVMLPGHQVTHHTSHNAHRLTLKSEQARAKRQTANWIQVDKIHNLFRSFTGQDRNDVTGTKGVLKKFIKKGPAGRRYGP